MPKDASSRPNFLIFSPDQHRYDWLGTNPAPPLRTPNVNQLAARGVRSTHCVTPSPLCAPARACLASGRDYDHVPNDKYNYPLDQPTYCQALRDPRCPSPGRAPDGRATGHRVAGVGKFDLHKATLDWGLNGRRLIEERGFTAGIDKEGKMDAIASYAGAEGTSPGPKGPYMAHLHARGLAQAHFDDFQARRGHIGHTRTHVTPLPDKAYADNWISGNGLRFLRGFPQDQPWFLIANFNWPHSPFDVTEAMQRAWRDVRFPSPVDSSQSDDSAHQAIRQNYAAMIENIDRQVGRLLEAVQVRGELERTLL